LGCSHIGDHPQEDLAKFGFRTYMKIKKFEQSFYIIGYLLETNIEIW
jgi:hypothetical protein